MQFLFFIYFNGYTCICGDEVCLIYIIHNKSAFDPQICSLLQFLKNESLHESKVWP